MSLFKLHPQLEADSLFIAQLKLSVLLLMNDERFPWVILVPRIHNLIEIHDLKKVDQEILLQETTDISRILQKIYQAEKMNVAALGNIVPQLHIHIVARFKLDSAWPKPAFGFEKAIPYSKQKALSTINAIQDELIDYSNNY